MTQIRKRSDNSLVTVPYAYEFRGEQGHVVIEDGEIIWRKDDGDVVDTANGTLLVYAGESMDNFFTIELEDETPTLPPDLVPDASIPNDLTYKTLLGTTGGYTTQINLTILNDEGGDYAVQISSEIGGGSLDAGGFPSTWATLTRQSTGKYHVILPCTGEPEPYFIRFSGNTNHYFGNLITFRADGSDPLQTTVTPPSTGTNRMGRDIVVLSWDGLEGHDYNSDNPNVPPPGADQGAWMLQNNRRTKERAAIHAFKDIYDRIIPHFGVNNSVSQSPLYYNAVNNQGWQMETTYRDVSWSFDYGTAQMTADNNYANAAGIAAWCFVYYLDDATLGNKRVLFENSTTKGNIKMTLYVEEILDTPNLNSICGKMLQSYWYKIDGRPVLILEESKAAAQTATYQYIYSSLGGVGNIYFVYLSSGYATNVPNPFEANCVYTLFNGGNDGFRNAIQGANRDNGKKIIPSFTTGLQNLAFRLGVPNDYGPSAYHRATLEECQARLGDLHAWLGEPNGKGGTNGDDCEFVLGYPWNEVGESARPIMPTRNATTGAIEKELLDTVEYWFKKS